MKAENKSWFRKHWIWTTVIIIVGLFILLGIIGSISNPNNNSKTINQNQQQNNPPQQINEPSQQNTNPPQQTNTSVSNQPTPTTVQTIGQIYVSTGSWKADASISGLEFYLAPKDADDQFVDTDGTVNIKLWRLECIENNEYIGCVKSACTKKDSDLIETWSIPVSSDSYGIFGAKIRAEYQRYKPLTSASNIDKLDEKGCADITLVTPDNKKFSSLADTIFLSG